MQDFGKLKKWIKDESSLLGACRARISGPRPPEEDISRYDQWIQGGNAAEMLHLSNNAAVRRDTRNLWPKTKSVVCIAVPFDCDSRAERDRKKAACDLKGYIACYARSLDYHGVLHDLLKALGEKIVFRTSGKAEYRVCVDTAPILERSLAESSGLGQIGRNKCLIVPGIGSRVVLGELLLNLEIEPDEPLAGDPCGECTLCINACPTGALTAQQELSPPRCLSYVTIEHRGVIQKKLSTALENRFFGCDTCLSVCPHNQPPLSPSIATLNSLSAKHVGRKQTSANPGAWLDLRCASEWSSGEIKRRFKQTALSRISASMFRRNLCEILGNIPSAQARKLLTMFLDSSSEPVRKSAERAFQKFIMLDRGNV